MTIGDILTPDRVMLGVEASSRKRVLETMSELLAASHTELSARHVFDGFVARERLGSTGLGHGVALPHARVKNLNATVGGFMRINNGIDYDSPDRSPVDLVFALVVPQDCTEEHLEFLSMLAEAFSKPSLREALRVEGSASEACSLLALARSPI